jgi:hypothetical protein
VLAKRRVAPDLIHIRGIELQLQLDLDRRQLGSAERRFGGLRSFSHGLF